MNNTNCQTIHQMGQAINKVVRQATGRDAVENIDMDHVTVAQTKHYEEISVSGDIVSFITQIGGQPLEKCIVQIDPVQEGSGEPSPENIRPITNWQGANIHVSPTTDAQAGTTYSISFLTEAGTVYGGTLDVITGVLTVDVFGHELSEDDRINVIGTGESTLIRFVGFPDNTRFPASKDREMEDALSDPLVMCSHLFKNNITSTSTRIGWIVYHSSTNTFPYIQFRFPQSMEITTSDAMGAYIVAQRTAGTPITVCYPLATPLTYQLTPTEIQTLLGQNYIWADAGNIEVTYKDLRGLY